MSPQTQPSHTVIMELSMQEESKLALGWLVEQANLQGLLSWFIAACCLFIHVDLNLIHLAGKHLACGRMCVCVFRWITHTHTHTHTKCMYTVLYIQLSPQAKELQHTLYSVDSPPQCWRLQRNRVQNNVVGSLSLTWTVWTLLDIFWPLFYRRCCQ